MDSRIKDTIVRHDKGFNCAQAVACTYCDLLGYKEEDVFRMTEGFGLGMGCMEWVECRQPVVLCREQCFWQDLRTAMELLMHRRRRGELISCPKPW